jgi:DNA repair protein RadC
MAGSGKTRAIVANGRGRTVRDWPVGERPRERLLQEGPQALSEAELLAVFLRVGLPGRSVLDLARDAIARFGSLNGLLGAPAGEIRSMPGFGPAKCALLLAVTELARRALREEVRREQLFDSPEKVRDYLRLGIGRLPHEVFAVLFLDAQHRLIADEELFRGTLTQTSVYPREVVRRALQHNAAAVILAHNHPSGLAEPSRADELLTRSLRQALDLVDVRVLDHLIVAGAGAVSFAERGLL